MSWLSGNSKSKQGSDSTQVSVETYNPKTWLKLPVIFPAIALTGGSLLCYHLYARNLRRYATIDHLPAAIYSRKSQKGLLGHVTSVGDGDNFRFFHTPGGRLAGWGWLRPIPTDRKDLKNQTIHVRIAGVDAPELAHFGKPAQPYGQEALDWLRTYLTGRRVRIKIHSRDRFDRVVANPKIRTWPYKWIARDVGVEQIKSGLATVFRQGGAEYGGIKEIMETAEEAAKKRKLGMWARGKALETPAEYKRRTRGDDYQDTSTTTRPSQKGVIPKGGQMSGIHKVTSWARWAIGR